MSKFYIQTFGCQMNVYDSQRIANMLEQKGFAYTTEISEADIIILNTCSVREKATNKVFSALGRIRCKKKPEAIFGIIGCVAREVGEKAFKRIPELNFVLGPQSYHKLPEILSDPETKLLNINLIGLEKFDELPKMTSSPNVAYIPVQEGCNHCCTYCIVPYTRGPEISRPFYDIIEETKIAATNGAIEICFLGQNVNGYKWTDSNGNTFRLSNLIHTISQIKEIQRIRFTSSYPTEMTEDLICAFKTEPKLLPFLNMPIQSGSQSILSKMNRPYSLELYIDIINRLRAVRPDIQISSDFIVGFPGETDEDFNETLSIATKIQYINSYSFKYSPRPHTAAALMTNQIDEQTKKERLSKLDATLNEIQRNFNTSCIGKTFLCLFESYDKTKKHLIFRTPYMQQCIVDIPDSKQFQQLENINIVDANKACLYGKFINIDKPLIEKSNRIIV